MLALLLIQLIGAFIGVTYCYYFYETIGLPERTEAILTSTICHDTYSFCAEDQDELFYRDIGDKIGILQSFRKEKLLLWIDNVKDEAARKEARLGVEILMKMAEDAAVVTVRKSYCNFCEDKGYTIMNDQKYEGPSDDFKQRLFQQCFDGYKKLYSAYLTSDLPHMKYVFGNDKTIYRLCSQQVRELTEEEVYFNDFKMINELRDQKFL